MLLASFCFFLRRVSSHSLCTSDDGLSAVLSVQALLVFDISLFSLFSFCKLLLNGANFQYLYDTFKIRIRLKTRASSINAFLVVLIPFFLTVVTSAVLWSYQICTTGVTSSGDMIVHSDSSKNRSLPSPPDAADAPSLTQDIYLVSSYHFMYAAVFGAIWLWNFSHCVAACFLPPHQPAASWALFLCISGRGRARAPASRVTRSISPPAWRRSML